MSIQKVEKYVCDVCQATYNFYPDNYGSRKPDWFFVLKDNKTYGIFCGITCLREWADSAYKSWVTKEE